MTFNQVLRHSLSVEKTTPAFCEICKKFTPTNQYARVTELPQILSINCGLVNEKEMTFLRKQMNVSTANCSTTETPSQPTTTSTPIKPCRYGANCSRVNCHFAHSETKKVESNILKSKKDDASTAPAAAIVSTIPPATTSTTARCSAWFPLQFAMEIDRTSDELRVEGMTEDGSMASTGNEDTSVAADEVETIPAAVEKLTMDPNDEEEAITPAQDGDDVAEQENR